MLKGDGNENGIKINRSNQQKIICTCSTLFFLINKNTNLHLSTFFCLSLPLFCRTTIPFVRLKRQASQLLIIFMEELSYVLRFYFFTAAHFHLNGFLPTKFVSQHFLCYHLDCKHKKITSKKTGLCLFVFYFFLFKKPGGHVIFFRYISVAMPVD